MFISFFLSTCLFVYIFFYLYIPLSVCTSTCQSGCLFQCLFSLIGLTLELRFKFDFERLDGKKSQICQNLKCDLFNLFSAALFLFNWLKLISSTFDRPWTPLPSSKWSMVWKVLLELKLRSIFSRQILNFFRQVWRKRDWLFWLIM